MDTIFENQPSSDAAELQEVLTRYIDSRDGYREASSLVENPGLSAALRAIADRRDDVAARMAGLIASEGEKPDLKGSPEAGIHRWWIRFRDKLSKHEEETILGECLRGERELLRTLTSALEDGHIHQDHLQIFREALTEIDLAIRAFETALGEHTTSTTIQP